MDSERRLLTNFLTCLELNIKFWTSTDLNSMRWLGLFKNNIFRKHLKLIFPHRDFIICIVSLAIFHPHFSIGILSSAFCHPQFSIRILSSAFFYPPSAIRRHPVRTLQRPQSRKQLEISAGLMCHLMCHLARMQTFPFPKSFPRYFLLQCDIK